MEIKKPVENVLEETLKNFTGTQKYILVTWENIELCKE